MKIVIVGKDTAGTSCAARLRRLNKEAEIAIIKNKMKHLL